jgi:Protoglobin
MAPHADEGNPLPLLTARELRTRKAFVGLDLAATRALQALHPWMEAHVHEVVEEFYTHLLWFDQPRWLLADPQRLARVKAAQTDSLLSTRRKSPAGPRSGAPTRASMSRRSGIWAPSARSPGFSSPRSWRTIRTAR